MAFGRMRNTKRSSSSSSGSYVSTITTLVFIALCVLGVWMLTSDNLVSPRATTRTSTPDIESNDIVKPDESSTNTVPNDKATPGTFEDNPGELPDDAIKNDEPQKPCLDNEKALKKLHSTKHFEHRERHCPEDPPTCLVTVPQGYKKPFRFAAALKDLKIWVLNVVNVNSPDTLPIIYERGLFGIYHDWCESFSTYPRTYDLLCPAGANLFQ